MRIAVFSAKPYDRQFLSEAAARSGHETAFIEARLVEQTAALAEGYPAVCAFVNDVLSAAVLERLVAEGVRLVALRCAGFNNVDLAAAARLGVRVARVPAYSPHAVAEHTVGLMLALNRKLYKAYNRVREGNFALDGLLGFDMAGRAAGIIGTGKIGAIVARILRGFGCRVLCYDVQPNADCAALGAEYVSLDELFAQSDIVTLHCPLVEATRYIVNAAALARMKRGVMLINTGRGALIDTRAAIEGLKSGRIGYLGLDVYEEEEALFFEDHSQHVIQDDTFQRLLTFPNVLITGHQAFFTREALEAIAATTMENVTAFERGEPLENGVG